MNAATALTAAMSAHAARRRVKRDLRFLRLYAFTVPTILRYRDDDECLSAGSSPEEVLTRIESGLTGEAASYRTVGWMILAVLFMPVFMAGFLWSGMYWLPVNIYWWPFERGNYGLPLLSLYEWLCFLLLAAYFVGTWAVLRTSRAESRRLATDFRRLVSADDAQREAVARAVADDAQPYPRARLMLAKAKPFAPYAELLREYGGES